MWIYPEAIFWSVLGTQCLNIRWFRKLNPAIPVAMLLLILLAPKGKDILRGVRDELVSIKENPLMLPTQLTPILTTLSEDTRIESRRILCNEWVAQFLVGFSPRFKLVSALPHYTDVSLYLQGRSTEAVERYFLQAVVAMEQADHLWDDFTQTFGKARALRLFEEAGGVPQMQDIPRLLEKYAVGYVVLQNNKTLPEIFKSLGYQEILRSGRWLLLRQQEKKWISDGANT